MIHSGYICVSNATAGHACLVMLFHSQVMTFLLTLLALDKQDFFSLTLRWEHFILSMHSAPHFIFNIFFFISSDIWYIINHVIIKCHLVISLLRTSAPLKFYCVTDTLECWGCPQWLWGGVGGQNSTVIIFCITFGIIRKMLFLKLNFLVLSNKWK